MQTMIDIGLIVVIAFTGWFGITKIYPFISKKIFKIDHDINVSGTIIGFIFIIITIILASILAIYINTTSHYTFINDLALKFIERLKTERILNS